MTFYHSCMQYSPQITPNDFQYVHHILVYLCNELSDVAVNTSTSCTPGAVEDSVHECRQGQIIAAWAVGGDVSIQSNVWCVYFL